MPGADSDPDISDNSDSLESVTDDGNGCGESPVEEHDEGGEEEEEMEDNDEENEVDEQVDEEGGEEEEEEEDKDITEKIESEEHGEDLKSVLSTHDNSNCKPTTVARDNSGADETDSEAQMEKHSKAPKDAKEAHGSHQPELVLCDHHTGDKNTRSLEFQESDLSLENNNLKSDSVAEKEAPDLQTKTNFQIPEESSFLSIHIPQRRPRSSSPGSLVETANKKTAIICNFFARGWCIKGNSCKFIHQKEEVLNTSRRFRGDLTGSTRNGDYPDRTGSGGEIERSKPPSHEFPHSKNTESSSKSPLSLQRALVWAYGGENHGVKKFHNDYNIHGAHDDGVSSRFESGDERESATSDFFSRRHLNGVSFTRGSPLTSNALVPEYRFYSASTSSGHDPLASDRRSADLSIRNQKSQFPLHDSYASHNPTSLSNPDLSFSMHSFRTSPSSIPFEPEGIPSTHGSAVLSGNHLDAHKTLDFDRGNYGSRSASLPRNSSPYYSETQLENSTQQNISRNLPTYSETKLLAQDTWAPSVPFRSSFLTAHANTSSVGSQYDPLLDSIEPPKDDNVTFETSQMSITNTHYASNQYMNLDPGFSGIHTPGYHAPSPLDVLPESGPVGLSGYNAVASASGPLIIDGVVSSIPKEKKHRNVVDGEKINETDPGSDLRNQEDKGADNKESKVMKLFRAGLVDFVKELVKPAWREGNLSKDAHKMVVKKTVEKVLGAIQPHQVPKNTESINQYLSASRLKLSKLVKGYVDKYTKT